MLILKKKFGNNRPESSFCHFSRNHIVREVGPFRCTVTYAGIMLSIRGKSTESMH